MTHYGHYFNPHHNIINYSKKRTYICHGKCLAVNLYTIYKMHTVAFELN